MASKEKVAPVKEKKVVKKTVAPKAEPKTVKAVAKPVKVVSKPKTVAKPVKQEAVKAEAPVAVVVSKKPVKASKTATFEVSVDVVGIDGKVGGKISLPVELFGEKINKPLLSQAVRVYLANQRQGNASTKTRGEVDGSTRKIFRQKGTGRARHGSVRAPIFVKGGIVFGPKPRDFGLTMPKKMKRKALFSALSAKAKDKQVTVLSGLSDIEPKSKVFATMLKSIGMVDKKPKLLFVTTMNAVNATRAGQNVTGVTFTSVHQLNAYEVLNTKNLIVMKDAVNEMEKHFLGRDK